MSENTTTETMGTPILNLEFYITPDGNGVTGYFSYNEMYEILAEDFEDLSSEVLAALTMKVGWIVEKHAKEERSFNGLLDDESTDSLLDEPEEKDFEGVIPL